MLALPVAFFKNPGAFIVNNLPAPLLTRNTAPTAAASIEPIESIGCSLSNCLTFVDFSASFCFPNPNKSIAPSAAAQPAATNNPFAARAPSPDTVFENIFVLLPLLKTAVAKPAASGAE